MQAPRRHKAFVICTDEEWRAFRAVCVGSGEHVQVALGMLVRQTVERAGYPVAAATQVPGQESLDDAIAGPAAKEGIARRRKAAPTGTKANRRSPTKKKGRPTR